MKLRRFNDDGVAAFRAYLQALRSDPAAAPPTHLLENGTFTAVVPESVELDRPRFATKRDAATYLNAKLGPLKGQGLFKDVGLWTWLSLYYFDDVCPPVGGKRKVLASERYVLRLDDTRYTTRHLLLTPALIFSVAPTHNRLLLDSALPVLGKVVETVMKRLYFTRNPGVFEAIELLYLDPDTGRAKKNITPWPPRAGDLMTRLPTRIRQLEKTYDVAVVSGSQIVRLLGREFAGWVTPTGITAAADGVLFTGTRAAGETLGRTPTV